MKEKTITMKEKRYFVKVKLEVFRVSWRSICSYDTFDKAEEEANRLRSMHPWATFRVVFASR